MRKPLWTNILWHTHDGRMSTSFCIISNCSKSDKFNWIKISFKIKIEKINTETFHCQSLRQGKYIEIFNASNTHLYAIPSWIGTFYLFSSTNFFTFHSFFFIQEHKIFLFALRRKFNKAYMCIAYTLWCI